MATLGIVSIIKKGNVILKAIAGSEGGMARVLTQRIETERPTTVDELLRLSVEAGFGEIESLVVMDNEIAIYNGDKFRPDSGDFESYFTTFDDPEWNPRWSLGTADFTVTVNYDLLP